MASTAFGKVFIGQATLLLALLFSYFLNPGVHYSPGGLSNYGVQWPAVIPYTAGLLSAAFFTYSGAKQLLKQQNQQALDLSLFLVIVAATYAIILISTYPYQLSDFFDTLHRKAGIISVTYFNFFTAWASYVILNGPVGLLLFLLMALGSLVALFSLHEFMPFLSHGQIIVAVVLAGVIMLSVRKAQTQRVAKSTDI